MNFRTATLLFGLIVAISTPAFGAKGGKTYGDSCNLISSGVQVWDTLTGGETNYANACDLERGLICAINKCDCSPGAHWEQNTVEKIFGTGGYCSGVQGLSGLGLGVMTLVAIVAAFVPKLFQ